ncbi:hypothetical protein GCM10009839_70050 [Catenulispora yoronensis]|uniref:Toxin-antitoxin system HicB family antitoxin n=1 Tax=Catenulispora yoronensis TaxID=450799 RepID=A0ABN2V8R5_9ACTN
MKLNPYVAGVRSELLTVAEAGGAAALELAERLTSPLEAAIRLTLLQALSAAAEEITAELAPGSVEVRLRGADPEFVVAGLAAAAPAPAEPVEEEAASVAQVQLPSAPEDDDGQMVRINLRLPAHLKSRVEEAADALGFSVNNWLVRAAAAALENERRPKQPRTTITTGQSLSGWAR